MMDLSQLPGGLQLDPIPGAEPAPATGESPTGKQGYLKEKLISYLNQWFAETMKAPAFLASKIQPLGDFCWALAETNAPDLFMEWERLDREFKPLTGRQRKLTEKEWVARKKWLLRFINRIQGLAYIIPKAQEVKRPFVDYVHIFDPLGSFYPVGGNGIMVGVKKAGKSNFIGDQITRLARDPGYAVATNLRLKPKNIRKDFGPEAGDSVWYVESYEKLLEAIARNMMAEETYVNTPDGELPRVMVIWQDEMDSTLSTAHASGKAIRNWAGFSFQLRKFRCCWWGVYHHEPHIPGRVRSETSMWIHKGYYLDHRRKPVALDRGMARMKGACVQLDNAFLPDIGEIPLATRYHYDFISVLDLTSFPTEDLLTYLSAHFTFEWPKLGARLLDFLEINRKPWEEPGAPQIKQLVHFDRKTLKPTVPLDSILRFYYGYPTDSMEQKLRSLAISKGRPFDESEYEQLRENGWTKTACGALYRKGRGRLPYLKGIDPPRKGES